MSKENQAFDNQTLAAIAEFQRNLQKAVNEKMLETEELISNNTHDMFLKSLDERINDFLIELEKKGQCLNVSDEGKELFQEVLEDEIKVFQESLRKDIEQQVLSDKELFQNSTFDFYLQTLEERAAQYFMSLKANNESFHLSQQYEDFISDALLKQEIPDSL